MLQISHPKRHVLGRWWRIVVTLVLALGASGVFGSSASAAPLRVRVRGTAKLVARASRDQVPGQPGVNELVLSGSLVDDTGQPLALQSVSIHVTRELDPHDPTVAEGMERAHVCDRAADSAPSGHVRPTAWGVHILNGEPVAITDEGGRFCLRARITPDRYKAKLVYTPAPGSLVDGLEHEITFDLTKRGLALRFDPTPKIVQLDNPRTTIEGVAILDDDANPRVAPGLGLVLANEKEEIGRAVTDASGRARFVLAGPKFGPVGRGELTLSFVGNEDTARGAHSEEIERHVKVKVSVPAAERGELTAGVPEEGIPLLVEVGSSLGPVSEGSVEARIGDVIVGAAPVERGIARLSVMFAAQGTEALVQLRYVPLSPWYEPLGESMVHLPIRGPSLLSKAPILLAGFAVLAFFLVGRVSAQKSKPEPAPANEAPRSEGKPRIEVVRPAERGQEGWTGAVVDAHERTPVRGARVWIERGTFEGRTVLASVETGADGRFAIPGIGPASGDEQIVSEARLHARHTQDLPAPGELSIALALRRRAMLANLVKWARRRGPPFDARPEPTPGHVRRAASGEFVTARWADAIERAVFGPGDVDARVEIDVDRLAPEARAARDEEPLDKADQERRRHDRVEIHRRGKPK